jgi:hypothetical protein
LARFVRLSGGRMKQHSQRTNYFSVKTADTNIITFLEQGPGEEALYILDFFRHGK